MARGRRTMTLLASVLTGVALATTPAAAQPNDEQLPVPYSGLTGLANATLRPDTVPPGANDWSCRPSPEHPNPVILVHGTIDNMTRDWDSMAPLLRNEGYCVFAFNYGHIPGVHVGLPGSTHTTGAAPIPQAARELSSFVDTVRKRTQAEQVDLVGHSQGGMMPRYYLKFLDGAAKVDKLIGLSPSNHGTTVDGLAQLPGVEYLLTTGLGPAVRDQIAGSPVLRDLNAGGDTVPGVDYTVIQTDLDEIVTPYTSAFLHGPNVTNVLLQDQCRTDATEHIGITFDPIALRDVLNSLDPAHAKPPNCTLVLPVNGGGLDREVLQAGTDQPQAPEPRRG